MLLAPAIAVQSLLADLLPARSLRRNVAAALLALGCWNALPHHQQIAERFDAAAQQVWLLVEASAGE